MVDDIRISMALGWKITRGTVPHALPIPQAAPSSTNVLYTAYITLASCISTSPLDFLAFLARLVPWKKGWLSVF